ncbi:MAG: RagB/SusD family nutrient uptake outer membrane protein [Bacteroidota bacterium]
MKNVRIYMLSFCFIAMALTACDEQLDVQPQQSIDESTALSTERNVLAALVGAYDGLGENDVMGGGQHLTELFADDGDQIWAGTFEEPEQIFQKRILVQNLDVERFWIESYEAINRANNVLSALDVVNTDLRGQVEGEAKFIRALVYFDLINLCGKTWIDGDPSANPGVPLVLTPTRSIDASSEVPRNTVAEIYAQVISDLTDAKNLLPENNGIFATTYAASGFLSRVYLMQERFTEAQEEVDRVIRSNAFSLTPNFADAFNQGGNTTEDIFTIEVTTQDGLNDFILFYAGEARGGRGDIDITQTHLDQYEAGDARLDLFYIDVNGIPRTGKWQDNANQDGNINIIRLAELYLTRAETRFRAGDTAGAAEDLNVIRTRVGLPAVQADAVSLESILQERKLELMFEGHMFRDKKRNRISIGGLGFNADELLYPIPQREMDVNLALIQNPGY